MVTTRNMEEQSTRDLIRELHAQIEAQAQIIQAQAHTQQEMRRKHEGEMRALRAERGPPERSASNRENANEASHNRVSPNGRTKREPTPLQVARPTSLLPFTITIMQTPMPERTPPVLDKYDGSADPDNHLRTFSNSMAFYTDSDPIMCRAFSLSLKEEALEWYHTLPPNSVDCFATVEDLFKRQYASNRKQEVTPVDLINTKQEKGETLKAFMKRYTETTRRVREVDQSFIINNLPSCMRPGYFAEKLYARPPKTMEELQDRAAEFIRMEEMRLSQKKRQQEGDTGGSGKDGKRPFGNNDKNREFPRPFKFHHYTTLNAPRAKVLEEAFRAELITPLRKSSPRNADERRSCRYHQNHGHNTEDCITLKNEIESLIRAGYLRRYIKEARHDPPKEGYSRRNPDRSSRKDERRHGYSRSPSRSREPSLRGVIN
ncbi:uncharacterized protein LOC108321059 [Vigna angularis]|uniref:uncharacterized protein LOC108321059 n=1 Tax=Phaseolus angularis TaxID=3914 RepID=UPI00080A211C|nr:uncharacterized protein LOC108321059 [Vigna angularis]